MEIMCPEQMTCLDYFAGQKKRSHEIRMNTRCFRYSDGTCPMTRHACNIEKVKRAKEKLA